MVISCSQNRRTNEACFLQMHNVCSSCLLLSPAALKWHNRLPPHPSHPFTHGQHPYDSEQDDDWLVNVCACKVPVSAWKSQEKPCCYKNKFPSVKVVIILQDFVVICSEFFLCENQTGLKDTRGKKRWAEGKPANHGFFRLLLCQIKNRNKVSHLLCTQ